MKYEAVIGLEVHAQLQTNTKIFCGCETAFGEEANTRTCPVCIGMPGVLPVLNRKAVEYIIKTGLATHCTISPFSRFARKNYFYPDLPKGYQISQYELPLCEHGYVEIVVDGAVKRIGITRIHLEEDAGKNLHTSESGASLVDLNRAGTPLMEIVSEPDIRTADEAAEYLKKLRSLLRYIEVSDADMEKGNFRCDCNVSIRPVGAGEFGTRAEVKNVNSFKFVQKALEYEIKRQAQILDEGGRVVQETRLFDSTKGITFSMRSKEEAHDYRYFPEPDLVPVVTSPATVESIRATIPELPDAKRERFVKEYGLPEYDADMLTQSRGLAAYFEESAALSGQPKVISNWMMGELMRLLNADNREIEACPVRPDRLAGMVKMITDGVISTKIAKTVFEEMYRTGKDAGTVVQEQGLVQVSDTGAIERIIDEVIKANPAQHADYKTGKDKLFGFFVGQVMKASKGKANPDIVNQLLKKKLAE
ncbi:MAG: Asp-tRNA(Asn)/Glu-tRNA(Gln) amidotransferase subunit GatB [Nitrospirae bacterium]|nr:Asp-tRNA(Asn)/Glu-tRNA(Gln) amidotransferase subunit GatB [Nitrospirota bacterium]NTW64793.1 Asp-tRNA(Asn)/Glu-tRNA(Gln) amidotransferase subunit GatB [Nitrospirota bacterium]